NNGFENRPLGGVGGMGAPLTIPANCSFYIYRTSSPFNGIVTFNAPSGVSFNTLTTPSPFNTLTGYTVNRIDSSDIRITIVYK
ncbi:MAG: hypothetical protein N2169_06055, partial [bacterium]|nr:hypothetical protein [bacterium]